MSSTSEGGAGTVWRWVVVPGHLAGRIVTMSIEVREVDAGSSVERFVHFSALVVPGVRLYPPASDSRVGPKERVATLTEAQLAEMASVARAQARTWHAFSIPVSTGQRLTYDFTCDIRTSATLDGVRKVAFDGTGAPVEDTGDAAARPMVEALDEARRLGLDNLLIVHPDGAPLHLNAFVMHMTTTGRILNFDSSYRGELTTWCGNIIVTSYDRLHAHAEDLTIAHEMGHAMGLGHGVAPDESDDAGGHIMFGSASSARHLTRSDAVKLHRSVERGRRVPGMLVRGLRGREYERAEGPRAFRHAR